MNIYTIPQRDLKYVRKCMLHLSMEFVSIHSGVSASTIHRIETGFTNVGEKYVIAIRDFYARYGIARLELLKQQENDNYAK